MSNAVYLSDPCIKLVKSAAKRRKLPVATYVNEMVKSLGLDNDDKKVILTIPLSLVKNDKDGLQKWLDSKVANLMNVYYPSTLITEPIEEVKPPPIVEENIPSVEQIDETKEEYAADIKPD